MRSAPLFTFLAAALCLLPAGACGGGGRVSAGGDQGGPGGGARQAAHGLACKELHDSIPGGAGSGVPGVAGAPRWGMPEGRTEPLRVRRSWSQLSEAAQRQVAAAFLKLKQTTVDGTAAAGAARANYKSFCTNYARNLYDYYVELHAAAFTMMNTPDMRHAQMAHMGPQFLPWHRYVLLRLEADLREVSGDPAFTLPYWDWEDCQAGARRGANPCPKVFDRRTLGSAGSCDQNNQVAGYLVDQGFTTHLWTNANANNIFSTSSINCSQKALQREVGCTVIGGGKPATAKDVAAIATRPVYDATPYDSCGTDENVSFRQYVEGYTRSDVNPACVIGACQMHGRGHFYIGGDMTSGAAAPNDPVFFLHHANIDRLWAMWQDRNRANAATSADYGNPGFPDRWRGPIFNFPEVRAEQTFDFRALGYRYDTSPER